MANPYEKFEKIYLKYREFLKGVLWRLTGDKELFADAFQNALLLIWQNIGKLDNDKPGGYIYRIAQSSASKAWKNRVGRQKEVCIDNIEKADPIGKTVDNEQRQCLRKAICQLPASQAQAVAMRYFEEKDYEEISERIGCRPATARSHVSKALKSLKLKLAKLNIQEK